MYWEMIVMAAAAGFGVGLVGGRVLRSVGAGVPAGWCEVASALFWGVVAWRWQSGGWPRWWVPVPLAVTALAVPLALADLRHLRLPNVLTLAAYPVFAVAIGAATWSGGHQLALRAALGAVAFAGAHAMVHLLSPHSLGAGDVKLAGSLGAVLGSVGWAALVVGAGLAAVCTTLLAIVSVSEARFGQERFRRWGNCVPHGPGLLVATWLIALFPGTGGEAGLSG